MVAAHIAPPRFHIPPEAVRAARQHHLAHLGRPSLALGFQGASGAAVNDIEVGVFGAPPEPVVLATGGASAHACRDGVHREWVMIVRGPLLVPDAHAALLARVAALAAPMGQVLAGADVKGELRALSSLDALALLPAWPLSPALQQFKRRDGIHVELGLVLPVSAGEAAVVRDAGADALIAKFRAQKVDVLAPRRAGLAL